mgnify:CR=1 FL=1
MMKTYNVFKTFDWLRRYVGIPFPTEDPLLDDFNYALPGHAPQQAVCPGVTHG